MKMWCLDFNKQMPVAERNHVEMLSCEKQLFGSYAAIGLATVNPKLATMCAMGGST